MFFLVTVPTDSVIIEAGIFDQSDPFAPPRWDVAAIVLIEVLAEEGCKKKREEERRPSINIITCFTLFSHSFENINPVHLCDFI